MDRTVPDLDDALTAGIVAFTTRVDPLVEPFNGEPPSFQWHANWHYDPSPDSPMAHGLSGGFGAVAGRLMGHEFGLAFRANRSETALLLPDRS